MTSTFQRGIPPPVLQALKELGRGANLPKALNLSATALLLARWLTLICQARPEFPIYLVSKNASSIIVAGSFEGKTFEIQAELEEIRPLSTAPRS